jgi:hypothetical protein
MHASRASRNNSVFAGELGLIKKKISPFAEVHACKRQLLEKKGRKGGGTRRSGKVHQGSARAPCAVDNVPLCFIRHNT